MDSSEKAMPKLCKKAAVGYFLGDGACVFYSAVAQRREGNAPPVSAAALSDADNKRFVFACGVEDIVIVAVGKAFAAERAGNRLSAHGFRGLFKLRQHFIQRGTGRIHIRAFVH